MMDFHRPSLLEPVNTGVRKHLSIIVIRFLMNTRPPRSKNARRFFYVIFFNSDRRYL